MYNYMPVSPTHTYTYCPMISVSTMQQSSWSEIFQNYTFESEVLVSQSKCWAESDAGSFNWTQVQTYVAS